ncbi:Small-conductance mechanosensitive channel [Halogranum gelatinilyticum]|uniref:Small-conductance mechanosensitive channel n=1 Tax=Halogranum gelatinilyticum TaxID=660521 RepID=A0A1G9UBQ4_9EURY|nr:Small-conductance mechanosensitive channel [Halogranum gelatinilyticum]
MLLDTALTATVPLQTLPTGAELVDTFVIPALTFLVGFLAIYFLGKTVLTPVVRRVLDSKGFDSSVKSLADSIMGVVVWVLALTVALTLAGFGGFIAALGVFGGAVALAVGFAAQDLLGNFVAGIFILKDKPFQVGDWIEVNDISGRVQDIDLRVTRVKTFDNELVTVPNGDLANNALTNPVAFDKLRQKFVFGIGYDDDIEQAKDAILQEANDHEEILADPAPDIRVTELGDSAVGLQTRFWIDEPSRGDFVRVRSDLVQAVKERFDAEGIDMPYPHTQLTGGIDVEGIQTASATPSDD